MEKVSRAVVAFTLIMFLFVSAYAIYYGIILPKKECLERFGPGWDHSSYCYILSVGEYQSRGAQYFYNPRGELCLLIDVKIDGQGYNYLSDNFEIRKIEKGRGIRVKIEDSGKIQKATYYTSTNEIKPLKTNLPPIPISRLNNP